MGQKDPLGKEMATHSSILAWKIPWIEESGGLQSLGSQRVGPEWVTCTTMPTFGLFTLSSYLKFFIIGKFLTLQLPEVVVATNKELRKNVKEKTGE